MSKKSRVSNIFKQQLAAKNNPQPAPTPTPILAAPIVTAPTPTAVVEAGSPPAPKKQVVNHVIVLLDDSGSMDNCYQTAVQQLEDSLLKLKATAAQTNQKTLVTMYVFSNRIARVNTQLPIEKFNRLDRSFYRGGRTMLIDANVEAIQFIRSIPVEKDTDTSYLVLCATDGGDNCTRYGGGYLEKLIKEVQDTDRWTLAFMVPPGTKRETARQGIPLGNIIEWENTSRGATLAFAAVNVALDSYATMRSTGGTSTKKFFVKTDLSALTKAEVQQKLQQLSNFKFSTVEKEQAIKEYAQEKTGKPYVLGALFYALTKKETVQANKDVLLVEKGTKVVYGGPAARAMVGLPAGQSASVDPGNHANWDVFVKSTSVNRVLVRGTKVLIDVTKMVPDAETWDSAAAQAAADLKKAQLVAQTTT